MLLGTSNVSVTGKYERKLNKMITFCARKCILLSWTTDKVPSNTFWHKNILWTIWLAGYMIEAMYFTKHGCPLCHILVQISLVFLQEGSYNVVCVSETHLIVTCCCHCRLCTPESSTCVNVCSWAEMFWLGVQARRAEDLLFSIFWSLIVKLIIHQSWLKTHTQPNTQTHTSLFSGHCSINVWMTIC